MDDCRPYFFKNQIMMKQVKVYISLIGQNHATSINIDGIDKRIVFSGAEGDMNGTYTTGDTKEQEAIESNPAFNKRYGLHKTYDDRIANEGDGKASGLVGPGIAVNGSVNSEVLVNANIIESEKPLDDTGAESGTNMVFKNINEAQSMLSEEPYNVPKSKIRTSAEIIAKGVELGLNIEFRKD